MAFQIVGVQTFGSALSCAPGGLTAHQWGICIYFGIGNLAWQQVINLVHGFTAEGSNPGSHGNADEAGLLKFGSGRIIEPRTITDSRSNFEYDPSVSVRSTRNRAKSNLGGTSPGIV